MNKNTTITLRISTEEKAELEEKAKIAGLSLSGLIIAACNSHNLIVFNKNNEISASLHDISNQLIELRDSCESNKIDSINIRNLEEGVMSICLYLNSIMVDSVI